MIDMPDRTDIHMRLIPLENRRIPSRRIIELRMAPVAQRLLYRTRTTPRTQGAGGVKEGPSERHFRLYNTPSTPTPEEEKVEEEEKRKR